MDEWGNIEKEDAEKVNVSKKFKKAFPRDNNLSRLSALERACPRYALLQSAIDHEEREEGY